MPIKSLSVRIDEQLLHKLLSWPATRAAPPARRSSFSSAKMSNSSKKTTDPSWITARPARLIWFYSFLRAGLHPPRQRAIPSKNTAYSGR